MTASTDGARRIGENIRAARIYRGLSLKVTAELAGRSKSWFSKVENGQTRLERRADIRALAKRSRWPRPTCSANPHRRSVPKAAPTATSSGSAKRSWTPPWTARPTYRPARCPRWRNSPTAPSESSAEPRPTPTSPPPCPA
ncbi:helix-turn-helix transcriptional regulator [Spirillospora sp. NPDC052269]